MPKLAEEAHRVLPDPVEYIHADRFLAEYGITKDELISRRVGARNPYSRVACLAIEAKPYCLDGQGARMPLTDRKYGTMGYG